MINMCEILTVARLAKLFDEGNYNYMDAFHHKESDFHVDKISINQSIKLNNDKAELRIVIETSFELDCNEFKTTFQTYENTTRPVTLPNGKTFEGRALKGGHFDPSRKMPTKEERKKMNELAISIINEMKANGDFD